MKEAVRLHAKSQSKRLKQRITISDVIVASLRRSGFEREDILEALQRDETVDIDVRRRQPATERTDEERVREYLQDKGCMTEGRLTRNLHINIEQTRRGLKAALDSGAVVMRPFDRPVFYHWQATCRCKTALAANLPKEKRL